MVNIQVTAQKKNGYFFLPNLSGELFLNSAFSFFVIFALGLLAYFPVFFHQFQALWDDQWVAVNAYTELGLGPRNLWDILTEYYHGQYAPVNQLYYTILYSIFGYNPMAFHSVGLFIHLINGFLVYKLLIRLLALFYTSEDDRKKIGYLSLCSAVLFVVHPVNVEAVAWVAASKILLYATFYLLALISYLKYINTKKFGHFLLSLVYFIISFGAKEQAVTFPLCIILIDYFAARDLRNRAIWYEKILVLAFSLVFGLVTIQSQAVTGGGIMSNSPQYPISQRLVFACYSIIEYLTKGFFPIKLSYIYPFPNLIGDPLPGRFLMYPFAIIGGLLAFWKPLLKNKVLLFSAFFFLIHIAVTLHIIPISRFAITADRYIYVSLIPVCLCFSLLVEFLLERQTVGAAILRSFVLLCLVIFICYTNMRSRVWRDSVSLKKELKGIIKGRADYEALKSKYSK